MRSFRQFADISNNNASFDAAAYRGAGHVLIAIKATEGATFIDEKHALWARAAHAQGLAVMHYHYGRPDHHPRGNTEAAHFWRVAKPVSRPGDLLCVDLEVHAPLGPHQDAFYLRGFQEELRKVSGHGVIAYTYDGYLEDSSLTLDVPGSRWWVAKYGGPKPKPGAGRRLWAWQYTDGKEGAGPHEFAGIGRCDGSVLNLRSALRLRASASNRWRA